MPMLNVADKPVAAESIDLMEKNLVFHGIDHERLTFNELRRKFPEFTFPPTYEGILEHGAGVLFSDKCLAALKV